MSFYTSLTGLNSATAQLAVTSNNIANVGTSGFKRSRADFGDIFSTSPLQKSSSNIGQGVSLKQVSQEFSQGNISTSGNSLDLAITGDGFFPLKTPDGLQDTYTRNGSFTLNDQNNVVNSTGQRLMAASVDSSGKADLTNLNALTIPPKTSGEAVETTKIQLGLNLPADSAVITADFDRTNPSTYNKSTALTVYDSGGNGYLATVYYAKTQNATLDSPFSKWQTYFFVGDTEVKPALQQATDNVGSNYFVNKYGDVLPKSDPRVVPSSGTTEMYSLDQLTDIRPSSPAKAVGTALPAEVYAAGSFVEDPTGSVSFKIKVDGATEPTEITYELQETDKDPQVLARHLEIAINNVMGSLEDTEATEDTPAIVNARYGITVEFDPDTAKFSISSGTTGDGSSISIVEADAAAITTLGLEEAPNLTVVASTTEALRGKPSLPAVLRGEVMTINTAKSVQVTSSNKDFFVSVDGTVKKIELPFPTTYTNIEGFAKALQDEINTITDPETGRQVSGVTVAFDTKTKQLSFTTGTTGSNSAIQVTGSADWGLANTEMQFGATTDWKKLAQFTENGALQFVKNGEQTEDATGLSSKTEWWPVYLDRGELSFDLTGKPVSPLTGMPFETAFLQGGKGALTMSIDFTKSTQYSSAFAVLSQSQDGAPEGELMGLNIGPDGLVNATYSNGSQVSLGKIVLANFSSPSGLRQVGDASYLASASSGSAKIGEAGSAGFGSIRAGATERANVDLTQELVDLITAQRNFQANAKAIETSSTMTSAIINIRA
ncbi:flagellar hook-basal body complex protein [Limnohabitans sp.]|uniref:flagellar hook-basal body complex protein n=1 Tax=Limnohabitans sp. TaxID=1907725 RepID=UPI002AFE1D7C|nr:flagellar hook-basal body complex protein [Limnohabitans sp.]